jgi:hypothetical protein
MLIEEDQQALIRRATAVLAFACLIVAIAVVAYPR